MTRLRQNPPTSYQLGPNDVLGIYIETVLGESGEAPPVHFPEDGERKPSIGYPIPVREDGTIALPFVDPIHVAGLTLTQTTEVIRKAYTIDKEILPADKDRIIVTLMEKRTHRVLVVREEAGVVGEPGGRSRLSNIGNELAKRGAGYVVDLPAYENDLLHALNETGGLPGLDAKNEIVIFRGTFKDGVERDQIRASLLASNDPCSCPPVLPDDPNVTRIPIRYYVPPTFMEEEIILYDGDIVLVQARDNEKFYTGGVLPGGEYLIPRDYDLDILQAIALAGGPVGPGAVLGNAGGGRSGFGGGTGPATGLPPSRAIVLRKLPCGRGQVPIRVDLNQALIDPTQRILIQPEDVILVQYTSTEEIINTALSLVRFNILFNGFSGNGF